MKQQLPEQQAFSYTPVAKRKSLSAQERAARNQQTDTHPPANPRRAGHYAGLHPEDAPFYTDAQPRNQPR